MDFSRVESMMWWWRQDKWHCIATILAFHSRNMRERSSPSGWRLVTVI